jgi:hypothetical protein
MRAFQYATTSVEVFCCLNTSTHSCRKWYDQALSSRVLHVVDVLHSAVGLFGFARLGFHRSVVLYCCRLVLRRGGCVGLQLESSALGAKW